MYLKKLNEILKIFSISMNMKTFIVSKLYCVLLSIDDVAHAPDVGRRRIVCKWILATFPTVCQHSFVCLVGALWVHCHLFMTAAEMQTAFVILFLFFIFWKEKLHAFVSGLTMIGLNLKMCTRIVLNAWQAGQSVHWLTDHCVTRTTMCVLLV